MKQQMIKLPKPFTQSVPNTIVTCRLCRGCGLNTIVRSNGNVVLRQCSACKGVKQLSNRGYYN